MKALQYHSPEIPLVLRDVPPPEKSMKKVVVEVKTSALNHRDVWICEGLYPNLQTNITLGSDGVVHFQGKNYLINPNLDWGASQHAPSDLHSILGMPKDGTFAQKIALNPNRLVALPEHLSLAQGAALPLAGVTAFRLLFRRCQLEKIDRVCITGIGGGVALIALRFALAAGAEVWVTSSSEEKIQRAMELGAAGGQLYTHSDWHKELKARSGGFDVIIDSAGGDGFSKLISICRKGARIGLYGGSQGKIDGLSPQIIFWKHLSIFGSSMGSDQDFLDMVNFVDQEKIVPVVDSIINLSNYEEAFSRMAAGAQFGKIVLDNSK